MKSIDPAAIPVSDLNQYLVGAIAPRPIAFVSTIDAQGIPNIAPYSFFNVFSVNPPVLAFSCTRKPGADPHKDTLRNVLENREVVVNVVPYAIVRQMTIASMEYPSDINEFDKTGLTPLASDLVRPFRIAESPVQMECRVRDTIPLGDQPGASTLVLCDVIRIHLSEDILDEHDRIEPDKIDLMARMGRAFYVRASGTAVHTIVQPFSPPGIGFDQLPLSVRASKVLRANDLGRLAAIEQIPTDEQLRELSLHKNIQEIIRKSDALQQLHLLAAQALEDDQPQRALQLVWISASLDKYTSLLQ